MRQGFYPRGNDPPDRWKLDSDKPDADDRRGQWNPDGPPCPCYEGEPEPAKTKVTVVRNSHMIDFKALHDEILDKYVPQLEAGRAFDEVIEDLRKEVRARCAKWLLEEVVNSTLE